MMRRKLTILVGAMACLLLALPAYFAFAGNDFLNCDKDGGTIKADEELNFKVDLKPFETETNKPYSIELTITPAEPAPGLDLQEDVNVTYNKKKGTYVIKSEDFVQNQDGDQPLDELNFTLNPDTDLEDAVKYTITARVTGGDGFSDAEETITFTAEPKAPQEPETEPSQQEETTEPETKPDNSKDPSESTETTSKPSKEPADDEGASPGGDFGPGSEEPEYKGSSDNYLKSLSVAGHHMTQDFHKTRDTYFVDLDKTVSSLDVHAAAEDRTAKVDIAGNNNVSVNMSKIVINVTAQNGDLRVYRIYVRYR